jgi:PKD repeat protein
MKRRYGFITGLLLLVALLSFSSVGATGLEFGNFDYNNHGWTLLTNGGGAISLEQSDQAYAAQGVGVNGTAAHTLGKVIDTSGFTTIQVMYWTHGESLEAADTFQAQWSLDGGTIWNTFQQLSGNVYDNQWALQSFTLVGAGNQPDFALRFIFQGDDGDDVWYIDEIMVLGDGQRLAYGDFGETFDGWEAVDAGNGTIKLSKQGHHDFDVRAFNWGAHQLFKTINTSGFLNLTLSYYIRGVELEAADTFRAEWSPDGGVNWNLIQILDGQSYQGKPADTWRLQQFTLPLAAGNNPNLVLRFTFDGDHSSDNWYIDEINSDGDIKVVNKLSLTNDGPAPVNQPVTFTALASGEVLNYVWDFGDGSPLVTTSQPVIAHTYLKVGNFTATVTAQATLNNRSATSPVTIRDVAIADLTLTYDEPLFVNQAASFTATISAGTNVIYHWDFGDGSPVLIDSPKVSHTFLNAGPYTVIVVAFNSESNVSAQAQVTVEALPAPVQSLIYLPLALK